MTSEKTPHVTHTGGSMSLHRAAGLGNAKMVRELLTNGAKDIDAVDKYGWTALHHAAWLGNEDTIQCLLDAGADTTKKNSDGQTAEDLARLQEYRGIAEQIRGAIAQKHNGRGS